MLWPRRYCRSWPRTVGDVLDLASAEQAPTPGTTMPFVAHATMPFVAPNATRAADVLDVASAEPPLVPGTTLMLAARNETKWDFGEEEGPEQPRLGPLPAAYGSSLRVWSTLSCRSLVSAARSSAKGAAWRSSVVGYLTDVAHVAAETSVRGRSGTPLRRVPRSRPMSLRASRKRAARARSRPCDDRQQRHGA